MSVKGLFDDGTMKYLLDRGLVTPTVFNYLDIFIEVKTLQQQGMKKSEAIQEASIRCKVCERTVWTAVKTLEMP